MNRSEKVLAGCLVVANVVMLGILIYTFVKMGV